MKRLLLTISLFVTMLFSGATLWAAPVYAVDLLSPACQAANQHNLPTACKDNSTNSTTNPLFGPNGILTLVINILSLIAGVIAVFVIIIAGLKMITSSGDSNSVASARQAVLFAVISLVIVATAQAAVFFLLRKLNI